MVVTSWSPVGSHLVISDDQVESRIWADGASSHTFVAESSDECARAEMGVTSQSSLFSLLSPPHFCKYLSLFSRKLVLAGSLAGRSRVFLWAAPLFSYGIMHILRKFAPRLGKKGSRPGGCLIPLGIMNNSAKALCLFFHFLHFLSFSFICTFFHFRFLFFNFFPCFYFFPLFSLFSFFYSFIFLLFSCKKCFFLFHFVSLFSFLGCSKSVAALQDSLGESAHSECAPKIFLN